MDKILESEHAFVYGKIKFTTTKVFIRATVEIAIVPLGYLVRDTKTNDLYMFENYQAITEKFDIKDYNAS